MRDYYSSSDSSDSAETSDASAEGPAHIHVLHNPLRIRIPYAWIGYRRPVALAERYVITSQVTTRYGGVLLKLSPADSAEASDADDSSTIAPNASAPAESQERVTFNTEEDAKENAQESQEIKELRKSEAARRKRMTTKKANEEEKRMIIAKLLATGSTKKRKAEKVDKSGSKRRPDRNMVRFKSELCMNRKQRQEEVRLTLSLPIGFSLEEEHQSPRPQERDLKCVECGGPRKYLSSKTQKPLCSLSCYKIHNR